MHWIEAKVTFRSPNEALAVDLIADIFDDLGTKGVVVDDPHLNPQEGWGDDAVSQPTQPAVTGYLPVNDLLEQKRLQLVQALIDLAGRHDLTYTVTYQAIDEQDWAESWKAYFWPQIITPHLVVKPTWRDYTPEPGQQVIEIDPGMAFGTGTHPTTTLCMQMLERYICPGLSVLDVGTGSGILLITAAKLGAERLTGVDLDPSAVDIAQQNLKLNRIAPRSCRFFSGNLIDPLTQMDPTFDLVVANILAQVVIALLDDVGRVLKPGGILILSGIIEAFQSEVTDKMSACGFEILEILKQDDWVAIAGQLKKL
jgi:ribosomal protein L11 methyltransferase